MTPLTPESFPANAFRAEASRRFAGFWLNLTRQGLLPLRSSFDPSNIPDLLPMILLREIETDGSSRYRLAGTGIGELIGEELTKRDTSTVMPEAEQQRYDDTTRLMFEQPCGLRAVLRLTTAGGRSIYVENLSFPFQPLADGRRQTLGLLSLLAESKPGHLRDEGAQISATTELSFIDLGAGVPELPPLG